METFEIEIPANLDIYFTGDIHLGESMSRPRKFQAFWKKYIEPNRNARVVGMGDWISSILPNDKRFDIRGVDKMFQTIVACKEWVGTFLGGNRKRFLWFHTGNHEERLAMGEGDDIEAICKRSGVRYGGFTAFVTLKVKGTDKRIRLITTHGTRALNSTQEDPFKRDTQLRQRLRATLSALGDADVYVMGHSHVLLVHNDPPDIRLAQKGDDVEHYYAHNKRWYGSSGSFLRTYVKGQTSYGERFGYRALEIGCLVLHIRNGEVTGMDKVVM